MKKEDISFSLKVKMPELSKFLSGFGLNYGLQLAGFELISTQGAHNQIVRYREYAYPLILTFQGSGNPSSLVSALNHYTTEEKTIYSAYGNPYKCTIDPWRVKSSSGNQVVVTSLGHSYRI